MKKQKLYLVKREVYASNIKEALTKDGIVYEIQTAGEENQPEENKKIGF